MLRQDRGLLLGQGHQPFAVSQLWELGLVWQDVLLQACQPVSQALPLAVPSVWVLVLRQHHSSGVCFLCFVFSFLLPPQSNGAPFFCCHASEHIHPEKN